MYQKLTKNIEQKEKNMQNSLDRVTEEGRELQRCCAHKNYHFLLLSSAILNYNQLTGVTKINIKGGYTNIYFKSGVLGCMLFLCVVTPCVILTASVNFFPFFALSLSLALSITDGCVGHLEIYNMSRDLRDKTALT